MTTKKKPIAVMRPKKGEGRDAFASRFGDAVHEAVVDAATDDAVRQIEAHRKTKK